MSEYDMDNTSCDLKRSASLGAHRNDSYLYQWLYMYKPFGTGIMMACVHSIPTCACLLHACMPPDRKHFFLMREGKTHSPYSPMSCTDIGALTHIPTRIVVVCSVGLSLLRIPQYVRVILSPFTPLRVRITPLSIPQYVGMHSMHRGCMISVLLECRDCEF